LQGRAITTVCLDTPEIGYPLSRLYHVTTSAIGRIVLIHFLGFPDRIDGPIFCTSKIISCVVSSVAKAEFGAAFQNAQKAAEFRNTLHELGYSQQPTTIMIDNTVAEELAADTINAKRSKAMDVRFLWLRDRLRQGQNIYDFFTKSLPKDKYDPFHPYVVVNLDNERPVPKQMRTTITMLKTPLREMVC
jgi:hypothetical protein